MGLSVVGLDADRAPIRRDGLVELALPSQRIAEVVMGLSEVGLDADRLAMCDNRLVELALRSQCEPEAVMGLSEVGPGRDRLATLHPRLLELALRSQCEPEVAMGLSEVELDRLVELALAPQRVAEAKMAHSGRRQLSGWGTQFCSSATLFAVHRRTRISNWPIAYSTRAMEKIIAHLPLLSRGLIDGVTALYRPWSVIGRFS